MERQYVNRIRANEKATSKKKEAALLEISNIWRCTYKKFKSQLDEFKRWRVVLENPNLKPDL